MAGNWKMYKTPAETTAFFEKFRPLVEKSEHCEIVICPPYTNIAAAVAAAQGTRIGIGAQDLYWAKEGAFTGEVSGPMIKASGCTHVLVGHSERRQYFEETNETVLQRTVAALDAGLTPIVCVGERLAERESGETEAVLSLQFRGGIALAEPRAVRAHRDRLRAGVGHRHGQDGHARDRRRCASRAARAGARALRRGGRGRRAHPVRRQRQAGQRAQR